MSSNYLRTEGYTSITKKQKHIQPSIRQVQLTPKQKAAQKIWVILRDAMRLKFFKTMEKIRNYNFDVNRKKFVNENFHRGYKIQDKKASRLRPRARTLDPYAEYSRARVLQQIASKLSKKQTNNITITQFDSLNLEERIIHMERMIQESMNTKQQNSRNEGDSNNSAMMIEIAMELIKLKKQLAKRQGSEASNRYPETISNISRQQSQGQLTNNSEQIQKHTILHKNDFSYTPSEKNVIKNIDSRYERIPEFRKPPENLFNSPKNQIDQIKEPYEYRKYSPEINKYQYQKKYPPLPQKPIQKPLHQIQNATTNTVKYENKNYIPPYQPPLPPQIPQRQHILQNTTTSTHQIPIVIHQNPVQQTNENPIQTLQSKYTTQTRNNYFSPQHHHFGSNNPLKIIEERVSPFTPVVEQTKPIQKEDRKGKKLNVVSHLPYKRKDSEKQKKAEKVKPPILFGKGPMKNENDEHCDECGRRCKCEADRYY